MTLARNIVFSATVYWKFQKMIDAIHLCSQVFAQHTNVKRLDRVLSSCVCKCCQHCCQVVVCVRVWGGWWRLLKHTVKDWSILRWGNHPGCFAEWCNKNVRVWGFLPSAHVTKSIPSPWNRPLTWGHWESKINRQNSLQLLEWNCAVLTSCMVAAEQSHFSHKKQYSLIATNIQYCIKIFSHSSLLWVLFVEPLNADLWIIQA